MALKIFIYLKDKIKGEVVSLTDPSEDGNGVVGPGPGLRKYCQTPNLRVIGRLINIL